MATRRPDGRIKLVIGSHSLRAEKWGGKWVLMWCESWPDIAERHQGCEDATEAIEEFTRRATAAADARCDDGSRCLGIEEPPMEGRTTSPA